MAYADPSGLYDEIHVASWDGASWQVDVAVGPSANDHFNHQVGMVIDRSGLPAVAYRLSSLPYELRVSRHDGTSWVALPPPATDVNFFASTSLELDPMGNLAVVYVQNPLGALVYAVWNGNIWTQEILVADGVESFDYRLDRQGDPAIAIWDYGDGALRLARWTDQIHRGELPTALVPIATTVLPWDDPEPVLDPTAPALYYYQVDGVSEISLIEVGQTIRIQ